MSNFELLVRKLWFLLNFTNKAYNRIVYTELYLIFFFNGMLDKYSYIKKRFQKNKFVEPLEVHYTTILNETHKTDGQIRLEDQNVWLVMHFDSNLFNIKVDKLLNKISNLC